MITGANSGIGKASAIQIAQKGYHVILACRDYCIRVTNVKIDISRYPKLSKIAKYMYSIKSKFSISPEEMAKTYTYLATSDQVSGITGKYFNEKNTFINSSKYSYNKDNIKKEL
jgi:NAD(P)-dependent dehydrogenase (short-subunit alcohol dehydrogenase family)